MIHTLNFVRNFMHSLSPCVDLDDVANVFALSEPKEEPVVSLDSLPPDIRRKIFSCLDKKDDGPNIHAVSLVCRSFFEDVADLEKTHEKIRENMEGLAFKDEKGLMPLPEGYIAICGFGWRRMSQDYSIKSALEIVKAKQYHDFIKKTFCEEKHADLEMKQIGLRHVDWMKGEESNFICSINLEKEGNRSLRKLGLVAGNYYRVELTEPDGSFSGCIKISGTSWHVF